MRNHGAVSIIREGLSIVEGVSAATAAAAAAASRDAHAAERRHRTRSQRTLTKGAAGDRTHLYTCIINLVNIHPAILFI